MNQSYRQCGIRTNDETRVVDLPDSMSIYGKTFTIRGDQRRWEVLWVGDVNPFSAGCEVSEPALA